VANSSFTQDFNRYSYARNNPLAYTDPSGEFIQYIIGAVVGGAINLGIKVAQGKVNSFWDGLAAFGIGAAAGAIGAATGGAAFVAAGGAAGGVGGFLAGAAGGAVGTAFSSPVLSMGNSAYFGDPMMTGKQYLMGIAMGGLLGGTVNGITALANGRSFWTGTVTKAPTPAAVVSTPTSTQKPSVTETKTPTPNNVQNQTTQLPDNNSYTVHGTKNLPNPSIEGRGINLESPRPQITGYKPSLDGKTDLFHNFPSSFDDFIIQNGTFSLTGDGRYFYMAPGSINGTQGWYTIGSYPNGVIYHRCFFDYLPLVY